MLRQWTPTCRNLLSEHVTGKCGVWPRQNRAEWRLETGSALEVKGLFSCNFYFGTIAGSLLYDEYQALLLSADGTVADVLSYLLLCILSLCACMRVCDYMFTLNTRKDPHCFILSCEHTADIRPFTHNASPSVSGTKCCFPGSPFSYQIFDFPIHYVCYCNSKLFF